jgi:hypothetical protein
MELIASQRTFDSQLQDCARYHATDCAMSDRGSSEPRLLQAQQSRAKGLPCLSQKYRARNYQVCKK